MPPVIVRYSLDPTGASPNNLVAGELHTMVRRKVRAIVPMYGAFFTYALRVTDTSTNTLLTNGVHYHAAELYELPTAKYGKEICAIIIITDEDVGDEVSIQYQALGGDYSSSTQAIVQLIDTLNLDDRPLAWQSIIEKPSEYPPSHHLHDAGDIYGFEYVVHAMDRVRRAIEMGDEISHDKIYQYIDSVIGDGEVAAVRKPKAVIPTFDQINVGPANLIMTSDTYRSLYGIAHKGAQFQIATTVDFVAPLTADIVVNTPVITTSHTGPLATNTRYYWRVRYFDMEDSYSEWSDAHGFTTANTGIARPSVISPTAGSSISITPTFESSAFAVVNGSDSFSVADWEIWTGSNRSGTLVYAVDDVASHSMVVPNATLNAGTVYHVVVRHKGLTLGYSDWSPSVNYTTIAGSVNTPTIITPGNAVEGVSTVPVLIGSAFATTNYSDTFQKAEWEIWTGANGTGTRVFHAESTAGQSISVPSNQRLLTNTRYYPRVRYYGISLGASSFSPASNFKTALPTPLKPYVIKPDPSGSSDNAANNAFIPVQVIVGGFGTSSSDPDTMKYVNIEIWTGNNATGTLVYSSYDRVPFDDGNPNRTQTGFNLPTNALAGDTLYYIRASFEGNTYGLSAWSDFVAFKTRTYISAINVTNGGSGYTSAPTVNIAVDPNPGGSSVPNGNGDATATANLGDPFFIQGPYTDPVYGSVSITGFSSSGQYEVNGAQTDFVIGGGDGTSTLQDRKPTITLTGGGGIDAAAKFTPVTPQFAYSVAALNSVTINDGGSGYSNSLLIRLLGGGAANTRTGRRADDGPFTEATFSYVVTDGVITSITCTNSGANGGYHQENQFQIVDLADPSKATGLANVTLNWGTPYGVFVASIGGAVMTNVGSGYTTAPTVTVTGTEYGTQNGGGQRASVSVATDGFPGGYYASYYTYSVVSVNVTNGGTNYYNPPPAISFSGGGGSGAVATAVLA